MTEATLALALTDFVPVILSTVALAWIAVRIGAEDPERRGVLVGGVVLVAAGGVAKATGKLILALSGRDVVVLNEGLFPALAPGMLLLALGVAAATTARPAGTARRSVSPLVLGALVPVVWAGAALVAVTASWSAAKLLLIVITSVANVALLVLLARAAASDGSRAASVLFIASLLGVLSLAGMSRALEPTIANQWIEQSANALVQALLLLAVRSWRPGEQGIAVVGPRVTAA